jgi:trimethylamine---corrinoid protein Co-methyltransferase
MYERMHLLSSEDFSKLHDATMEIFKDVGVAFHEPEAMEIFRRNGVKTDGNLVYLRERDVQLALDAAPAQFQIEARNPEKSVTIGGTHLVISPGLGNPFMVDADGGQRPALMEDYENFCKLVHTSKFIDMTGYLMVEPHDRPADTAHLDMMYANIVLGDKPFLGSGVSRRAALDSIAMAGIAWGGKEKIKDRPVMMGIISSLSPLQYSPEMAAALIEFARHGQANMCGLLMQAGSTGPVTLPGLLAVQNAEILAGVTLAQLVNPGAPVVYGTTSTITEMRTGGLAIGAPELSMIQNASMQMAKHYGLPCRGSGTLTDAQFPDMQAGIESTLALTTTVMSGANFILHGAGTLGSYIAMSYEKFLADEEICGMLKRMLQPLDVTDARIDLDTIKAVGAGGEYLTHTSTFEHCRTEFYLPGLISRKDYATWDADGRPRLDQSASALLNDRLAGYVAPDIDPEVEKELAGYVTRQRDA